MTMLLFFPLAFFAVVQPLPFSHKHHAGTLKLACQTCHQQPEPEGEMTLPAETICASCHLRLPTKPAEPEAKPPLNPEAKPPLNKDTMRHLQEFLAAKKPIPWQRVYQLPTYVFWNHTSHLNAGITCGKCHGPVAEREVLTPEVSHKMADCVACHRASKAGTDCAFCHEQRN